MDQQLLKGSTVTMILSLLHHQPMYGYQIIKEIDHLSQGVFQFKEGSLYPLLHSLERNGWLQSTWEERETGRKRKYYRLTPAGEEALQRRHKEWVTFRAAVDHVIRKGVQECHV